MLAHASQVLRELGHLFLAGQVQQAGVQAKGYAKGLVS